MVMKSRDSWYKTLTFKSFGTSLLKTLTERSHSVRERCGDPTDEASHESGHVKEVERWPKGIPYASTLDGRTRCGSELG